MLFSFAFFDVVEKMNTFNFQMVCRFYHLGDFCCHTSDHNSCSDFDRVV